MNGNNNSTYRVNLSKKAEKYLNKSTAKIQSQLKKHKKQISQNPFCGYPLHGELEGLRAIDSGEYRIIYRIYDDAKMVVVLNIHPRGDVYKKFK